MRAVIPFSILLGLIWNVLVVSLMGGRLAEALRPSWLVGGAVAGALAGWFTVWSRRRREGGERFLDGLATYYLALVAYWASYVVVERASMCVRHGGWTDFDLRDHLLLIVWFLVYGTLWYGILLIPLTFLTRHVVWGLYRRATA
jgi:hypothetical protein